MKELKIYSRAEQMRKYFTYYLKAGNGRGHGIHSPFVFNFIKNVLQDKKRYPAYREVEVVRCNLLQDKEWLEVEDLGAGSAISTSSRRRIKDIARTALKPKKFGQLLFRIAQYYKPLQTIELGTSLGITTAYLAKGAGTGSHIHTIEGSTSIAAKAKETFYKTGCNSINLTIGNFNKVLPRLLHKIDKIDLAFIDGNHKQAPTLQYFHTLLKKAHKQSVFIFDDIHWSRDMEDAWQIIKNESSITLTIDLFFIGLVFFDPAIKVKQHFVIRF